MVSQLRQNYHENTENSVNQAVSGFYSGFIYQLVY